MASGTVDPDCTVVGSTHLASQLDAEDGRNLLGVYLELLGVIRPSLDQNAGDLARRESRFNARMHSVARGGRLRRTVVRDGLDSSNPVADASHPTTQSLLRRDTWQRGADPTATRSEVP
jgi:hypothetical protein